jgi:hypothetical protein
MLRTEDSREQSDRSEESSAWMFWQVVASVTFVRFQGLEYLAASEMTVTLGQTLRTIVELYRSRFANRRQGSWSRPRRLRDRNPLTVQSCLCSHRHGERCCSITTSLSSLAAIGTDCLLPPGQVIRNSVGVEISGIPKWISDSDVGA